MITVDDFDDFRLRTLGRVGHTLRIPREGGADPRKGGAYITDEGGAWITDPREGGGIDYRTLERAGHGLRTLGRAGRRLRIAREGPTRLRTLGRAWYSLRTLGRTWHGLRTLGRAWHRLRNPKSLLFRRGHLGQFPGGCASIRVVRYIDVILTRNPSVNTSTYL